MFLAILGNLALAGPNGPPLSITLAKRGQVVMDDRKAPLNQAKPFLLDDTGSHKRARAAKTLSTLGTITAISGAALVLLGTIGISDGDAKANAGAYSLSGSGFVVLGAGLGFKIGATRKWKRSVADYQGPTAP